MGSKLSIGLMGHRNTGKIYFCDKISQICTK